MDSTAVVLLLPNLGEAFPVSQGTNYCTPLLLIVTSTGLARTIGAAASLFGGKPWYRLTPGKTM